MDAVRIRMYCDCDCFLLLVQLLTLILSPSLLPPWMFLARAIVNPHAHHHRSLHLGCVLRTTRAMIHSHRQHDCSKHLDTYAGVRRGPLASLFAAQKDEQHLVATLEDAIDSTDFGELAPG